MNDIQEEIRKKLIEVKDFEFDGTEYLLAKAMGVPQGSLWRFLNEDTGINMATLQKVFDYLGGRIVFDPKDSSRYVTVKRYKINGKYELLGNEESLVFCKTWLESKSKCHPGDMMAIEFQSDAMSPTITQGDTVLVAACESEEKLTPGYVYLICKDGTYLIKRYRPAVGKGLMFLSDNRRVFWEDIQVESEEEVEIIGRVIWLGRENP